MIPLLVGTLLAITALAFVLMPLLAEDDGTTRARVSPSAQNDALGVARTRAVDALREIEFDRETGKLSDSDYAALKSSYTAQAVTAMRAEAGAAAGVASAAAFDPAEVALERWRARERGCLTHGRRPEADAEFCSACGRYLAGACAACGAAVAETGARYCSCCGEPLVMSLPAGVVG